MAADSATVTFSLDFPHSNPEHYVISVQSDGHAHYESNGIINEGSDDRETYQTDFNFSDVTRARIFDLAAQAHYFLRQDRFRQQETRIHGSEEA